MQGALNIKYFTVALKMIDVSDKKQMYHNVNYGERKSF